MKFLAGLFGPLLLALPVAAQAAECDAASLEYLRRALEAERQVQAERMLARMAADCAGQPGYDALLARFDLLEGRSDSAFSRFAALAARHPEDPELASGAGRAALQAGRLDDAFLWLTRATALPGSGWLAWNALGVLLDRRGDWAGSAEAYDQALLLSPDEAAVWNNRGYSRLLQGRFQEALPDFDRAVALDSNNLSIRRTRDLAYALAGIYHDARRPGESAAEWARRLNNMGYAAWLSGNRTAARSLLARAIQASETRFEKAERNLARVEATQ